MGLENSVNDESVKFNIIGNVTDFVQENNKFHVTCGSQKVQVIFYKSDMIRILWNPLGEDKDPTGGVIIDKTDFDVPTIGYVELEEYYKVQSERCVLRVYKEPLRFGMYDKRDKKVIWEEEKPLQYSETSTRQTVLGNNDEYFYGGGAQNGYFSHKNKKIFIEDVISHWNDGSVSNPAPFYMSTYGYGAFRNTFKTGVYEFKNTTCTTHNEKRFDCFYFYGPSLNKIIDGYTELTGRPSLIPRWGLGLGDSDCYNTSNTTYTGEHNKPNKEKTLEALKVIKEYREKDMPGSWFLPNDGYGCGYNNLKELVDEAWEKYGFRVGLWTENGVEKIEQEVRELGSRMCKLDVAWVGPGYEFALNACKTAAEGLENNSVTTDEKGTYSERKYVWSVCGWAGTQRYSTVWSGDQSGNWEYIRFHIPTYIGAGLSGIAYMGSDIDGIFGGSAKTQVRDLEWKTFTPIIINMSGWAPKDKQPWVWGEPYTSINRKYLKLRQRLTPYMYTYANEAYETGAPIVRGMVWEYPNDNYARGKETEYQFMCGNWLLVAPVYEDTDIRDEIYLPQGRWIDYWTGEEHVGGKVINNYKAPLDTLPLLVRAGAIIPMYPECLYDGEVFPDDKHPLTLDIYPSGITSFNLYEDDGHTTLHRKGEYAKTLITSEESNGKVKIKINATKGKYDKMPFARKYEFMIHTKVNPKKVTFTCGEAVADLEEVSSKQEWSLRGCCTWYFDKDERGGTLYIKTKAIPTINDFSITLDKYVEKLPVVLKEGGKIPKVPKNLRLTDVKDTSLKVEWDKVEGADYYEVKVDNMVYSYLQDIFTHKNLEFVSPHKFVVRAVNEWGASEWSDEIEGITKEDRMKDAVPTKELSAYTTSYFRKEYNADKAIDGDHYSEWISNYELEKLPQIITVDMEKIYMVDKIIFIPRDHGRRAVISKYNLYLSEDGRHFEKFISEGEWLDDGEPKTIKLNGKKVKSIRVEALECSIPEYSGASMKEIVVFKVPGTKGVLAADYTGDGKIDVADLNFALQYYRIKEGDNDWSYVSKADINKDGVIGIYDVSYVASLIEPAAKPTYYNKASGVLKLKSHVENVIYGQEFTIDIVGENLINLYAFEVILGIDKEKYELLAFESGEIKDLVSACKEKGENAYIAYTSVSNSKGISGEGVLAKVKLRAKFNGMLDLIEKAATIIGTNLETIDATSKEKSTIEGSKFEMKIPEKLMEALATSEENKSEDCSANNVLEDTEKIWHTAWDKSALLPQSLVIDLGEEFEVSKLTCLPREMESNGVITSYVVYAIDSHENETKISEGKWLDDGKEKEVTFDPIKALKIKLTANDGNGGYASLKKIDVYAIFKR